MLPLDLNSAAVMLAAIRRLVVLGCHLGCQNIFSDVDCKQDCELREKVSNLEGFVHDKLRSEGIYFQNYAFLVELDA